MLCVQRWLWPTEIILKEGFCFVNFSCSQEKCDILQAVLWFRYDNIGIVSVRIGFYRTETIPIHYRYDTDTCREIVSAEIFLEPLRFSPQVSHPHKAEKLNFVVECLLDAPETSNIRHKTLPTNILCNRMEESTTGTTTITVERLL